MNDNRNFVEYIVAQYLQRTPNGVEVVTIFKREYIY